MVNQIIQEQLDNQISQLKKIVEKPSAPPNVNIYLIMALRQLAKVLTLNEHNRFKVWRINKAIECLCTAMQTLQCTKETKNEIVAITCQLENITYSLT